MGDRTRKLLLAPLMLLLLLGGGVMVFSEGNSTGEPVFGDDDGIGSVRECE